MKRLSRIGQFMARNTKNLFISGQSRLLFSVPPQKNPAEPSEAAKSGRWWADLQDAAVASLQMGSTHFISQALAHTCNALGRARALSRPLLGEEVAAGRGVGQTMLFVGHYALVAVSRRKRASVVPRWNAFEWSARQSSTSSSSSLFELHTYIQTNIKREGCIN